MGCGNKIIFVACSSLCYVMGISAYGLAGQVKEAEVAGAFYPADPHELTSQIDSCLAGVSVTQVPSDIIAVISPHAGYEYSGKIAAYGYKAVQNRPYKTVVVIGTSHRYPFKGVSVIAEGSFRTPLGEIKIDTDFAKRLLNRDALIYEEPRGFQKEHSVEVQLPFIQRVLPHAAIVPIVMGDCSMQTCQSLSLLLKEATGDRKDVLFVASTDMYHGYDYTKAPFVDGRTLEHVKRFDAQGLYEGLREGSLQMCGGFGVVTLALLAKEWGDPYAEVLQYTDSSEVTGNKKQNVWTVGYSSCLIGYKKGGGAMLNQAQRKKLLEIARSAIRQYLASGKKLEVSETDPVLLSKMGAFVTLRKHTELRGCIGNLVGSQPVYLTIRDMAIEAATGDPRFTQVTLDELDSLELEISVLSPMEKVESADKIKLGQHGVLVRRGFASGVFLPQVADETGWSKEEFLSNLCAHKAGLPADCWKDKATQLYIFTAEVFSEK